MDILQAVFLGIVQGITEWLPISSSGHLALLQNYLGMDVPVSFDVFIHVGTLLAVSIYFRGRINEIIRSVANLDFGSEPGKEFIYMVIAMIPTALIGFALKDFFESMFQNNAYLGLEFILNGFILYSATLVSPGKKELNEKSSFVVGIAQGLAVSPAVSRSGFTISAGLLQGIDPKKAARFSFLLSIPAILGASFFELKDSGIDLASETFLPYMAGAAVAAVVGYLSIKFLLKVIEERKFVYFAYYCWLIGILVILTTIL